MTEETGPWERAMRALALLAVDPGGLKGMTLRARVGPVRAAIETALSALPGPPRRIHAGLSDTQLFGGLNVAASLAEGRRVLEPGLAEQPGALILPMAERTPPGLAARLAQVLDAGQGHALILLDEGAEPDEAAPPRLTERLAFCIDLTDVARAQARTMLPAPADLDAARAALASVTVDPEHPAQLAALAARFGIDSLRAPLLALRTARALAALAGRDSTDAADLRAAAELVYPARATHLPQEREEAAEDRPEPETPDSDAGAQDDGETGATTPDETMPDDMTIEAVAALLPPDMLTRLAEPGSPPGATRGSGAGARQRGNRRGRPLPSRPGRPDGRARIDVAATLRAAAPWQPLRRQARPGATGLLIHPGDIRLHRFEDRSDRLVIFAVDASGSSAMARMAEAKGAVELLLAQAYAKRDQVALVAFRGAVAEVLLPPTRSLVQAKRRLAALPGGGGTPLAAGLQAAWMLAETGRGKGLSPALVVLTDGRANVGLTGTPGRAAAQAEAEALAARIGAQGLAGVVIDTAARQGQQSAALARALGAPCLALPRADAERISAAANAALDG